VEYYCSTCDETVAENPCPDCFSTTDPRDEEARTAEAAKIAANVKRRAGTGSSLHAAPSLATQRIPVANIAPKRPPKPEGQEEVRPPEKPKSVAPGDEWGAPLEGQRNVEQILAEGYEVFLSVGIGGSGKTELLASYQKEGYASRFVKAQDRVVPTALKTLRFYTVRVDGRKVGFVDTSGESFAQLYPDDQVGQIKEVRKEDVGFLRLVSQNLGGLILLVDLGRLWAPQSGDWADAKQQKILVWILMLLRWLRLGDGEVPEGVAIRDHVDKVVRRLKKKLDVPVLVLFSKADALAGTTLPEPPRSSWLGSKGPQRTVLPSGEQPLLLAHHYLRDLSSALAEHAENYRFDFAHSLVTDPDSGAVKDHEACGVDLSLQWLLDSRWQRKRWYSRFEPSTQTLIAWQEKLDQWTRRGQRWRRLPEPEVLKF